MIKGQNEHKVGEIEDDNVVERQSERNTEVKEKFQNRWIIYKTNKQKIWFFTSQKPSRNVDWRQLRNMKCNEEQKLDTKEMRKEKEKLLRKN